MRRRTLTLLILMSLFLMTGLGASAQKHCVKHIGFAGNMITREKVLLRELSFSQGDCLEAGDLVDRIEESRQNLMNTSLFNFVESKLLVDDDSLVSVTFELTERWYAWVSPILLYEDRNFSTWLENGDIKRVSYGLTLTHNNVGGVKQTVSLSMQGGYNQQLYLLFQRPYLDKGRKLGLNLELGKQNLHETAYGTVDSRREFISSSSHYMYRRDFGSLGLQYRPGIHESIEATIGFENLWWDDTLMVLNPNLNGTEDNRIIFLRFWMRFKLDHRDYASYPLKGWYADLEFVKNGLGLLKPGPDEFYLKSTCRAYLEIAPKLYGAIGLHSKLSAAGPQPYFLNYGLGYGRDFVRGYEYYVIDGQAYAMAKANIKYELLQPREWRIPFIKNEKFSKTFVGLYLNLHFDIAKVSDHYPSQGNPFANRLLHSFGPGLDLLTYYDKVLRLEYSINHLNEGGIFIHFIAPV